MSDWAVGDLAVCVSQPEVKPGRTISGGRPSVGTVYRVEGIRVYISGNVYLILAGAPDCLEFDRSWGPSWPARRFRKIRPDEQEACEEEFVTLLKRSKQRVEA